jgi:hypothetical protein
MIRKVDPGFPKKIMLEQSDEISDEIMDGVIKASPAAGHLMCPRLTSTLQRYW